MLLLQSSLYAIAVGFCLLCIICIQQCSTRIPARFLIAFLALEIVSFSFEWLMVHPTSPMKSLWLTGVMSLSFFVPPCLWLYANEATKRTNLSTKALSSWDRNIIVIGLLMLVPLGLSTHMGTGFYNTISPTTKQQDLLIHTTMLLAAGVFFLQAIIYLKRCKNLLTERTQENFQLFSNLDDPALNTLRVLTIAVAANCLTSALRVLNCVTPGDDSAFGAVFAGLQAIIIAYVIIAVFIQEVGFKPQQQTLRDSIQPPSTGATNLKQEKYKHSALSENHKEQIQQKLTHAMQVEKCFTDNDINLAALCELIQENQHHVSQTINESHYQNFYDLINQYRVAAAKEQLMLRPEHSVIEIAFAVGFNSKSTFNAVFKRYAQLTPTQYRQDLKAQLLTS